MFGFVKADRETRPLGGEIYQQKKKNQTIAFSVLGAIAFILINVVFYLLSKT